ncbi:MAG TPA: hypothetical protein VHB47_21195 [Thermoanaerobaculia bacterium]|jgi:hypothetical protein|nr:hypothetical protein [Thermoanaerobaculia bacterium]
MTTRIAAQIDVVSLARAAYRGWSSAADVSTSTREAQAICGQWQLSVQAVGGTVRFAKEVPVSRAFRERIDLVDRITRTAYEMKVSGKNPTHEFFKDVFKVLEHNLSGGGSIQHFVFLTESTGVKRLQRGLGRSLVANSHDLGFKVTLEALD